MSYWFWVLFVSRFIEGGPFWGGENVFLVQTVHAFESFMLSLC